MTEVKKRWEFVEGNTVEIRGHKLTRIRALIDDRSVKLIQIYPNLLKLEYR